MGIFTACNVLKDDINCLQLNLEGSIMNNKSTIAAKSPAQSPKPQVWKFLFKYIKQARYVALGFLVLFLITAVLMRAQNYIAAQMIGVLSDTDKYPDIAQTLIMYLSAMAAVFLILNGFEYLRRKLETYFVPFSTLRVYKDLFTLVHKHSVRFFEEELSGNISGKVRNIVTNVENMYYHILFGISMPIIEIVTSLTFIALANKQLALVLGTFNLLFMAVTIYLRKHVTSYVAMKANKNSVANGIFVDGVTNSLLVKSFANYFYEKHLFFKAAREAAEAQRKEMNKDVNIRWLSQFLFDFMNIASYSLIFYFWYKHNMSVADVVLATSLIASLIDSIRSMSYFASNFVQVYGNIYDGLELLSKPCEVQDKPQAKILKVKHNNIEINKITYQYKENKTLFKNFTLAIGENEKIGLVGHSGSGKSTLIKLLLRYYDLQKGSILISGQNIADVTQESLRKNIAVIPQESTLFNRSIMENIRYGNPKATDKQVISAAKKAYIHDFIMSLPEQYNSKVGERGVMLSGGERQRIAIARAILKNAPILILDEATSALDSESEMYIQKSLQSLMKKKTVIAIAHRLSTLREMDKLIVMDKGKIIETGSHQDLINKKGAYYKFYQMQSSGFF